MRARNLKPGFFENEILGEADPLVCLLFAGLWGLADREGRLADLPMRIRGALFRYRDIPSSKVDQMLAWLDEQGFIQRYSTTEPETKGYIQVLEFLKHQRPHSKEKPSEIPPPINVKHLPKSASMSHQARPSTDLGKESPDLGHVQHALTPDSGLLTTSSLNPDSPLTAVRTQNGAPPGGGGPSSPGQRKTFEEQEAAAKAKGLDIWALKGEPGYCGDVEL